MLPLSLLNASQGLVVTVECKSGRVYTGKMLACDLYMNITISDAVCATTKQVAPELYIRGYSIKQVNIPEHLLDDIVNERASKRQELRTVTPKPNRVR